MVAAARHFTPVYRLYIACVYVVYRLCNEGRGGYGPSCFIGWSGSLFSMAMTCKKHSNIPSASNCLDKSLYASGPYMLIHSLPFLTAYFMSQEGESLSQAAISSILANRRTVLHQNPGQAAISSILTNRRTVLHQILGHAGHPSS